MAARRKKIKINFPPIVIRVSLIVFFASIMGFAAYKGVSNFLSKSPYFKIKAIQYDETLQFINKRELAKLKGKNIFSVDLNEIQKKLRRRYPQLERLRIMKRFPDQIIVLARERHPFAQIELNGKILTLDIGGVVLSSLGKRNKKLPFISGLQQEKGYFALGVPLKGRDILTALEIIEVFQEERLLSKYRIKLVNMENASKIQLTLSNKLDIIIDQDKMISKFRKLGVILIKSKINSKEVKYIDMRFKEPIVKK